MSGHGTPDPVQNGGPQRPMCVSACRAHTEAVRGSGMTIAAASAIWMWLPRIPIVVESHAAAHARHTADSGATRTRRVSNRSQLMHRTWGFHAGESQPVVTLPLREVRDLDYVV